MVFGAVNDFRQTLNATEQRWQRRQWQQASLSGKAQALMILASGLTVTLLWLTAAGIGGDTQPGALIALFVFAALASFEALMPVAGAFQHLGQVIASATRVKQIIDRQPEVTFPATGPAAADRAQQPAAAEFHLPRPAAAGAARRHARGRGRRTHRLARPHRLRQVHPAAAADPRTRTDGGNILLNGEPLEDYDETTLRRMTTVVSQRVHIFSDTLRENLRLAAPDADDARLSEVLQQVGLGKLLDSDSGLNAGWAKAAGSCPAANSAVWASPARCCTQPRCCCSTNRPKGWTPKPSSRSRRCCAGIVRAKR